jgi:hypothetical protein
MEKYAFIMAVYVFQRRRWEFRFLTTGVVPNFVMADLSNY